MFITETVVLSTELSIQILMVLFSDISSKTINRYCTLQKMKNIVMMWIIIMLVMFLFLYIRVKKSIYSNFLMRTFYELFHDVVCVVKNSRSNFFQKFVVTNEFFPKTSLFSNFYGWNKNFYSTCMCEIWTYYTYVYNKYKPTSYTLLLNSIFNNAKNRFGLGKNNYGCNRLM